MTPTTYAVGDIVRFTQHFKVSYINSNGKVDLELEDNPDVELCYMPTKELTLVRKAAPPEPAIGAVILYKTGSAYGRDTEYIRTLSGWRLLENGTPTGVGFKWANFLHARVHLYTRAAAPVTG